MTNDPTHQDQVPEMPATGPFAGVYSMAVDGHTHWSYQCPGCSYASPFFTPTEEGAAAAYDSHLATCRATATGQRGTCQ